jgi:hypothetical protein
MVTRFNHTAFIEHKNRIGIDHRRKAVRYHEACAANRCTGQGLLNRLFMLRIKR